MRALLLLPVCGTVVAALDIPRGWRSWNAFGINVDQTLMHEIAVALSLRNLTIWDGSVVSLSDLGYVDVGIDDGWQLAKAGVNGGFHNANGTPIVNSSKFPDLAGWVGDVHAMNLTAGFYGNNCASFQAARSLESALPSRCAVVCRLERRKDVGPEKLSRRRRLPRCDRV
jgi:hypothetical protein